MLALALPVRNLLERAYYLRSFTTTVNDIEHMESQSYNGVSVIKIFFHPGAKIEAAQISATTKTILRKRTQKELRRLY